MLLFTSFYYGYIDITNDGAMGFVVIVRVYVLRGFAQTVLLSHACSIHFLLSKYMSCSFAPFTNTSSLERFLMICD